MSAKSMRRSTLALAGGLSAAMLLAACGGGSDSTDAAATGGDDCSAYDVYTEEFGDLSGTEVSIFTSIVAPEDQTQIDSYKKFEECTGVTVNYEGNQEFENQVKLRAKSADSAPDLAIVPQPGLLATLVEMGNAKAAPAQTAANVDKFFGEDWKSYGTVDGTFYAAPLGANVKSLVWYSPSRFAEKGYEVPQTQDELIALSDKIAAEGEKPWCAGIESGGATGWAATDWMEDMMLREYGAETYDKWVNHEIPFNGPESTAALDAVGKFLKNEDYVNGGLGDVKSIATTSFSDAGAGVADGSCYMHRQASFYGAQWENFGVTPENISEDGDIYAFYFPSKDASSKPVLGGGEFIVAFSDRPEVQAFQTFLASDTWANAKLASTPNGGWVSANKGMVFDESNMPSPIDRLSAGILQDPNAVFRFDGSDMMPADVGAGSFWVEATNWITGQDTKTTVDKIEASWPQD